jgi:hypothetical protein
MMNKSVSLLGAESDGPDVDKVDRIKPSTPT